jgi:hypothetical protein
MEDSDVTLGEAAEEEGSGEGGGSKRLSAVDYVVMNDPTRKVLLNKIQELEETGEGESTPEQVEANLEKLCTLYDMLESEGVATGRATNILKELGGWVDVLIVSRCGGSHGIIPHSLPLYLLSSFSLLASHCQGFRKSAERAL